MATKTISLTIPKSKLAEVHSLFHLAYICGDKRGAKWCDIIDEKFKKANQ